MQSSAWKPLLRRIPAHQYHQLMLITTTGIEIAIQGIYRIEDDFMVIRGRQAGTMDAGRTLFVPFDQINFLGFQVSLPEAEVQALFGEPSVPATPPPPAARPEPDNGVAEGLTSATLVEDGKPKSGAIRRNEILERLRSRSFPGVSKRPTTP